MIIEYLNKRKGECIKVVGEKEYHFKFNNGSITCDIDENHVDLFLEHSDLFKTINPVSDSVDNTLDLTNIDEVIRFANEVQSEVQYDKRHNLDKIVTFLKDNGHII